MKIQRETKRYYWGWVPVYESYKKVMIPTYCESCGQTDGEYESEEGVNLLRYDLKRFKKDMLFDMGRVLEKVMLPLVEQNLKRPLILDKILKGEKFKIL